MPSILAVCATPDGGRGGRQDGGQDEERERKEKRTAVLFIRGKAMLVEIRMMAIIMTHVETLMGLQYLWFQSSHVVGLSDP